MKKIYFLTLFLTLGIISCKNNTKEDPVQHPPAVPASYQNDEAGTAATDTFEETIYDVINAFENKDERYLNSIISKEHGVVVLYRTGVFNEYKRIDKIDFNNPVPQNFQYPALAVNGKLKYESVPAFNCGTMEWSKHGLYCDTIRIDTLLSGVLENLRKYRGDNIADAEIIKFKELEKKSRRIVLATPKGDLIFYLTLHDNKWFLTVIDRITTDCSA